MATQKSTKPIFSGCASAMQLFCRCNYAQEELNISDYYKQRIGLRFCFRHFEKSSSS